MTLAVLIGISLIACSSTKGASTTVGAAKPTLEVKNEVQGNTATVHIQTNLSMSSANVGKERKVGQGHIHIAIDDGEKETLVEPIYKYKDLKAGKHQIKVSLHNNDHTPYDVAQSLEFEVK
ncbi:hypothetical protein D3C73_670560 [compost metagenome]